MDPPKRRHDGRKGRRMTDYIGELISRYPVLEPVQAEIEAAGELLKDCYRNRGKLLVAGNGGSSADSEHIVGELMKGFVKARRISPEMAEKMIQADPKRGELLAAKLQGALPAIALTGHHSLSSAYANDEDSCLVYAQQLYGYGKPGDVFLAISTSGNSENVLMAAVAAKALGIKVIALTGRDGGKLKELADVSMIVPKEETYQIQELHLPVYHALCLMLEETFFDA